MKKSLRSRLVRAMALVLMFLMAISTVALSACSFTGSTVEPLPGGNGGITGEVPGGSTGGGGSTQLGGDYQLPQVIAFDAEAIAADEGIRLTATVTPDTAYDKTVDWTFAFTNPSSPWATGKNVADYISVTPDSDGSLSATVKCKQAFGEQITITVASRSTPSKKATCAVGYVKKVTSMNNFTIKRGPTGVISEEFTLTPNKNLSSASTTSIGYKRGFVTIGSEGLNAIMGRLFYGTSNLSVGTIEPFISTSVSATPSDNFKNALTAQGLTPFTSFSISQGTLKEGSTGVIDTSTGTDFGFGRDTFEGLFGINPHLDSDTAEYGKLCNAINNSSGYDILLTVTVKGYRDVLHTLLAFTETYYMKINIDGASLTPVSSVALSNQFIVF